MALACTSARSLAAVVQHVGPSGSRLLSKIVEVADDLPTTKKGGAAFDGDLRSTSGLGMGDGYKTHTDKWLQGNQKTPMQYVDELEPIKVKGLVVASHGTDDPALGCPVEYIDLKGTTKENPATCKYTGYKYYSDDWRVGGNQ